MTLEVFPVWMLYRDFEVPIGSVVPFAGRCDSTATSPPEGWLVCDGRPVSRNQYNKLFKIIGTTYGAGDGSTTFNVPNFTHSTDSSGTFRPGYIKGTAPSYNSTTQRYSWSGGQFQLPNTTQTEEFNLDLVSLTANVQATIQEYAPTVSQWQVVLGASNNNAHDHASATPGDYRYTYIDDADDKTATHDNDPIPGGAQLHLPGRLRRHDQSVVDLPPIKTTLNATQIWALKNDHRGIGLYFPKSGPSVSLGENTELAGFGGPNGNNDKVDGNKYISFGTYNTSTFSAERSIKFIINTEVADKVTLRLIAGTDDNGGERPNNNGTNITIAGVVRSTVDESLFLKIVLKNEGDRVTRTIELIPNEQKAGSAHNSYGSWRDYDISLTGEERTSRTEFYIYAYSTAPIELKDSAGKSYLHEVDQDFKTKLTNFPANFRNSLDNYGLGSVTYNQSAASALGVQRPYGSYYDALGNPTYTDGEFDRFEVWNHTHRNDYTHTTSEASSGVIGGIDHPQSSVGANQSTIGSFSSLNGRFFVDGSPSLSYSLGSGSAVYGEGAGPYDGGGSGEYDELRGFGASGSEKYLSIGRYSSSKPSDGVRSFTVRLDTRYANVVEFQVIAGNDINGAERPQALGEGLYCQINNGRVVQVIPSNQEYKFASGKSSSVANAEYDSKYANWHTFRLPLAGVDENKQNCEFKFFSKTFSMPELASKFEKKVISAANLATRGEYAAIIGSGCAIYDFRDGPGKDLDIGNGRGNNEWGGFEHPREDGASNWIKSGDNSRNASKKYISLGSFTSPHVMNRQIQFKLNTNSTESVTFTLITGNEVNGGDRPNQTDESLYLEINNPDGGSRSDILLIPSSDRYDQIAKADTTAGKNDTAANIREWDALYGFWRDYTINLRENERGPNTRFIIYAKSNTPDPWYVEYAKKTVTVSVRDLEFSSGGPLAADPKGGTYGIRVGNGVDIVPFENGPGKGISGAEQWAGFTKPSGSTFNTHLLFGAFSYVLKDQNMLVPPGGGTSKAHVNTRKMSFQLDTTVSSFIEFKLIAGTDFNGGETPDHGGEDLRLEIRDSSNNLIRSNILVVPSLNTSGLSGTQWRSTYGVWKTYRITLNDNEKTPNTTFVLYSYSNTPTVTNNKINEAQGAALESLPGYPNSYINGVDQYGFVEVSYEVLDPKIPNVQTNYINGRDFYGLFQVSLIRNKHYPEVKLGDYLEAVDQYGLKQAETKYDTSVKWYANTKKAILPVSQDTNFWVGDAYLKFEMNEGCGIYPERSSSLNPAPGKNIDNYGKGAGNNEYGGFIKPSTGSAEHYISLGTFNSPFRVARRSVTFTLSTNDAYKLGFWLIAGNEYNGADVPNSSEGLKINVGGTTRTLIPGNGSSAGDIADAVIRSGGKPAKSLESYTNGGLPTGETWSTWFGQWREHIIPGDWYSKSNSVTFELFNQLDSTHGPVDDPGDYSTTEYPSSWSTSSPQIFQMHRNWTDVFAIAGINVYDRVNYYTLNSGCSIQKWRNGPGKDINVGGKGNGNNELGGFNQDTGPVKDSTIGEYIMFGSYDGAYAAERKVTLNLDTRGASMVELCVIVGTDENGGERPNETTESLYARIGGSSGRRVEVIPSQRKFVDGSTPTNNQDALWMKLYGSWHSYYIYLTESEKVGNLEIVLESNSTNTGAVEYNPTFLSASTDYPNAIDTYGLAYAAIHYSESCLWEFGEKTSLVKYESGPTSISRGNSGNNNEFAGFSKQSNDTASESYLMFGLWAPVVGTGASDGSAVGGNPVPSTEWGYRTISFKANTERVREFNLRVRQGNDTNGGENPNPNYPSERLEIILQRGRSTVLTQTGGIRTVTARDLSAIDGYQLQVRPGVELFSFRNGPGKNIDLGNGKGNNEWGGFLAPTGGLLTTSPSHFLFGNFFVNNVPTSHKPNREMSFKLNVSASDYVIFKVIAGNDVNGGERPNNTDESLYLEILSGTQSLRRDILVVPSSEASGKTGSEYDAQYGIWHLKRIDLNANEKTTSTTFKLYAKSNPQTLNAENYFSEVDINLQKAISNYAQYTNSVDHYGLADITYDSGTPGVVISTPENANTRFDNWDNFQYGLAGDDRNEETTVFIRNYVDQDTFTGVGAKYLDEIGNEGGLSEDYFAKRNFALSSDVHGIAYIEVRYDPSTNLPLPDGTGCEGNHAHSLNFQLDRGHNHVITGQTGSANIVGQNSNIEPRHLPMVYIIHTG